MPIRVQGSGNTGKGTAVHGARWPLAVGRGGPGVGDAAGGDIRPRHMSGSGRPWAVLGSVGPGDSTRLIPAVRGQSVKKRALTSNDTLRFSVPGLSEARELLASALMSQEAARGGFRLHFRAAGGGLPPRLLSRYRHSGCCYPREAMLPVRCLVKTDLGRTSCQMDRRCSALHHAALPGLEAWRSVHALQLPRRACAVPG